MEVTYEVYVRCVWKYCAHIEAPRQSIEREMIVGWRGREKKSKEKNEKKFL